MDKNKIKKLQTLSKYWINRLNLSDWDIKLKIRKPDEFELEEVQGEIKYSMVGKQAIVGLHDPDFWDNKDFDQDIEKTLIHELLHLRFDVCNYKDETSEQIAHQLLDDIAKILIEQWRIIDGT